MQQRWGILETSRLYDLDKCGEFHVDQQEE